MKFSYWQKHIRSQRKTKNHEIEFDSLNDAKNVTLEKITSKLVQVSFINRSERFNFVFYFEKNEKSFFVLSASGDNPYKRAPKAQFW